MTFPLTTGHIPTSTHQRPTGRLIRADVDHEEGRYVDALSTSRLPFGHGLGYGRVEYSPPMVDRDQMPLDGSVRVTVDVRNTGDRPCREVVQLYGRDPVARVTRPLVELLDWRAVDLAAGATERVEFTVVPGQFAYYDGQMQERVDEGEVVLLTGPSSGSLSGVSVRVAGDAAP
jgi:beta-glucosidase